jgi:nucleotide-binding universal stress UspA family protein
MYIRILVPVDGSPTSLKGLNEAIKLQRAGGGKLKIVHVVNELILDSSFAPSLYYDKVILGLREAGQNVLVDAEAHARKHNAEVESELIETIGARASNIILEAAKQWSADLIVMGTHGRRGLRRLALGSDAESVLRQSPVPVLMVRDNPDH